MSSINPIEAYINAHLQRKFPKGVEELRNLVFNTHSKLEDWMGVDILRASFKNIESSKTIEESERNNILADVSIQVHRLLGSLEYYGLLKVFLKNVEGAKLKNALKDKLSEVNRIRNEFAHPYGNYDLRQYDATQPGGEQRSMEVKKKLKEAIGLMETYLTTYHREWFLSVSK